ncbi:Hypothetical predicted protein [Mytilus galloprovincialis]|uniref:NCAM n=1 Tax=Mytilus galloprovincialis TaxID=29158 RepID=A0A8B6BKX8_MYTGA|nr:Hypothetical predicted protein [Mytilus galloprovincialis]
MQCPNKSENSETIWFGPKDLNPISRGRTIYVTKNSHRFQVFGNFSVGEYKLRITDINISDIGLYKCTISVKKRTYQYEFDIKLQKPPTGLIIENIDKDSILNALEGNDLILECSVISGCPKESLVWVHEGIKLLESTSGIARYTISPSKLDHLSQYTCEAISPALTITLSKTVTIKVHYAPDLYIQYENYTQEEEERVLTCHADGVPQTYLFYEWEHKSDHGNHIRFLTGSEDGVLHLPTINIKEMRYQDNGYYKCIVTNGIADTTGNVNKSVEIPLNVKGKLLSSPVFVADNNKEIFGEYQKSVFMHVNVYSNPKYTIFDIVDHNGHYVSSGKHIKVIEGYTSTTDLFYGNIIQLKGYKLTVNIEKLTDEYLQDYTFRVKNEFGNSQHSITVRLASTPDIPLNVTATHINNGVQVEWVRNFNGGNEQFFFIEYCDGIDWKSVQSFNSTTNDIISWTIPNLQSNIIYMFRMFSRNRIGESNRTEEIAVRIGSESNILFYSVMVGSATVTFILMMTVGAFIFRRLRLRRAKKNTSAQQDLSQTERSEERPYGPYDEINDDEIIENAVYNPDQETDRDSEYEQPVNLSTIKSESESSISSSKKESSEEDIDENHTFAEDVCLNSYEDLTEEREPYSPYTTFIH